jgi:hypothetical protein
VLICINVKAFSVLRFSKSALLDKIKLQVLVNQVYAFVFLIVHCVYVPSNW